ncbi:MAG: hypothetical protein WC120_00905 [Parcubacteria group bacterium]
MRKKTYWWKISLFVAALTMLILEYVGVCDFKFGRCIGGNSIPVIRTSFHLFLAIFIISIFLFFTSDKIFLKWLRFAFIWIVLAVIVIIVTPEYASTGIVSGPNREIVSICMSSLFVIISLIKIIWDSKKTK